MTRLPTFVNIRTFGVLSSGGGGLPKVLHDGHYGNVRLRDTFYVVNINPDTMVHLASRAGVELIERDGLQYRRESHADGCISDSD